MINSQGAVNVKHMDLQHARDAMMSWGCKVQPRMSNCQGDCSSDIILDDVPKYILAAGRRNRLTAEERRLNRKASNREHYRKYPEKHKLRVREYQLNNREKLREQHRSLYYKNHEENKAKARKYYHKNKEKILAYAVSYHQKNKKRICAKRRLQYQDKKKLNK